MQVATSKYSVSLFLVEKIVYSTDKRSTFICHHTLQRKLPEFTPKRESTVETCSSCLCYFPLSFNHFSFTLFIYEWRFIQSIFIHIHFPSPFTPLCLKIFSDRWFNSGAFYFMLCNTLITTVSRWVCYMRISHLLFISSPVIWVVWLSVWFKKVSNYPRKISLKTYEIIFQSVPLCFFIDNSSSR